MAPPSATGATFPLTLGVAQSRRVVPAPFACLVELEEGGVDRDLRRAAVTRTAIARPVFALMDHESGAEDGPRAEAHVPAPAGAVEALCRRRGAALDEGARQLEGLVHLWVGCPLPLPSVSASSA